MKYLLHDGVPTVATFAGYQGPPLIQDKNTGTLYWLAPGDVVTEISAGSSSGVTDHGALTGLSDDDHTQYLNQTRGDARYSQLGHSHSYEAAGAVAAHEAALDPHPQYAGGGGLGYVLTVMAANAATTTDSATLYFGALAGIAPSTTAGLGRIYIPAAGTIKKAYITANCATAGTAEAWPVYVRLNNTTDTLVESTAVSSTFRTWTNTSLSIAVVAGDYIEMKAVNPAWVTNPANVRFGGVIYIE